MNKDIIIDLPLVNQKTETEDSGWAAKTCGICSLKMLLGWVNPEFRKLKIMDLVRGGLDKNGYLDKVGWKHATLVEIAADYGVEMDFQRKFPKTVSEKKNGLAFIERSIKNKRPVMVSVFHGFNRNKGGHLVVVNGVRLSLRGAIGYYIQDPDPSFKGTNYFVSKEEFLNGWRGGMLWLK